MSDSQPLDKAQDQDQVELRLLDLLIVLAKNKWLIIGLPIVTGILAAIYALSVPDVFTASTKVLPPSQSQSSGVGGVLSQLGALGGFGGAAFGLKNPSDLYVAMLRSRRVADGIIQRFDLNNRFQQKLQSETRDTLAGMTSIVSEKDGTITIEVDDKDPKRAAELANAYVDELYKLTSVIAVTEAAKRRLFFERQVALAKESLMKVEAAAKQSLEQGGIVQVEGQSRAMLTATATLRAQITAKEVQIGAMRTYAAEGNPDLILIQQELEATKRALAEMEGTGSRAPKGSATNNGLGAYSLGLIREVKYYETVYDLLAKQYELAKIDEAKDGAVIQTLDAAIPPDRRSKPKRRQIVMVPVLVALLAAIALAFVRESIARSIGDPGQEARIQSLRRALRGR